MKALRLTAGIDVPPPPPAAPLLFASPATPDPGLSGDVTQLGPIATITPIRSTGANGQLVTVQVRLQNFLRPISGVTFTLNYPIAALRLAGAQSHRTGPMVPAEAVAVWNVAPAQNHYSLQDGRITLAVSTATPWPANGLLAEFTFTVQPAAADRYAWPLALGGVEATGNGFDNRPLNSLPAVFTGRKPLPGRLSGLRRLRSGGWELTHVGDVGASYQIETSEDLVHWGILTNVVGSTGSTSIVDPEAAQRSRRFYRAVPGE